MIMSMTGFGKKETQYEGKYISIEVRSLNSKNADINLRSPPYLRELDPEIRKQLAKEMHRGKIDLNIHVEFNGETPPASINVSVVKAYMKQLEALGTSTESDRMGLALKLPDTLSSEKNKLDPHEKEIIFDLLKRVIHDIENFRRDEGLQLGKDINLRLDLIESNLKNAIKIDPERNIKIEEKDLRIDTYRSSGAGGQHVNTTDSAVRITHLPTKIVVQCQNERSQHKNKETCFKMMKARLYEHELQKKDEENQKELTSKTDIGWGHQIRSYVLQPYQLVKDLRNKTESSNPSSILDGNIDLFIEEGIKIKK